MAAGCGISYRRTASLNDDPAFVAVLAGLVQSADVVDGRADGRDGLDEPGGPGGPEGAR